MSESSSSDIPLLYGVPMSRDDLLTAISDTIADIPERHSPEFVEIRCRLVAVGLDLLDEVDPVNPEDEAATLAREEFKAEIALGALSKVKDWHRARKSDFDPTANPLARHSRRPLYDAKMAKENERRRIEEEARDKERKNLAEGYEKEIIEIEARYQVTGKFLRETKYAVSSTTEENGIFLQRQVAAIQDAGSQKPLFTDDEARTLAGISLREQDHDYIKDLKTSLDRLARLHESLRKVGERGLPHGMFTAIGKARELYETGSPLFGQAALRPLRSLLDLTTRNDDELLQHFVETLDEGPFADCEQLAIAPFEGVELRGSITEIPTNEATEKNIEDDINLAVNRSGGGYVVQSERIKEFATLMDKLAKRYGEENIRIIRTLKPRWHPLPWYGIIVNQPENKPPLLVLETPIHGNATYCVQDNEWPLIIEHIRTEAQIMGARAVNHGDPKDQSEKVFSVAVRMAEANKK